VAAQRAYQLRVWIHRARILWQLAQLGALRLAQVGISEQRDCLAHALQIVASLAGLKRNCEADHRSARSGQLVEQAGMQVVRPGPRSELVEAALVDVDHDHFGGGGARGHTVGAGT
jgi:hypothetical protein